MGIIASWSIAFSSSAHFSILPAIYCRVLVGDHVAYPFINFRGGNYFGRFVPQQMPFAGINRMELMQNSVLIGAVKLRQRLGSNNYVSVTGNVVLSDNNFVGMFKTKCKFGVDSC